MSCRSSNSLFFLLIPLWLGGCVAPQPRPLAVTPSAPPVFELQGRMVVRHGAEGFSGGVRWRHGERDDEILLLSPLGLAVARVERDATGVRLDVSGARHEARDAADLTGRVLGWGLPLEALPYWVAGRPAPEGLPSVTRDDAMNVTHLRQQEWDIEFRDYRVVGAHVLPMRLVLRRDDLELRLWVDEWMLP